VKETVIPAHHTNYRVGRNKAIRLAVIHCGEVPEAPTSAEGMGRWFASYHGIGKASSTHKGVDTDSACTYVADGNTAAAAPGANNDGLHVELSGYARQTGVQWLDPASKLILAHGAIIVARWCKKYAIPARWLTDAQLADGKTKGLTTHAQITRVFGTRGGHTDPGPNFPADYFLRLVQRYLDPNQYYTVKRGDTLSGIALRFYGNASLYPRIAKANRIRPPYVIRVGQKLVIPKK
jgi:hypothetical protein